MSAHQWEACGNLIRTRRTADEPQGWLVAEVKVGEGESSKKALLMAASPALLAAALKVEELSRFAGSLEEFDAQFDAVMVDVRAAIALATGGAS